MQVQGVTAPLIITVLLLGIVGCAAVPQEVAVKAKPEPVIEKKISRVVTQQEVIERLLARAEQALGKGRLMLPLYDNAYDRYQAVLAMDPANAKALAGVQLVGQQYIALARDALQHSSLSVAQMHYQRAKSVLGDNVLLQQLGEQIETASRPVATLPVLPDEKTIVLSVSDLSRKNETIKAQLAGIAQEVQQTDEMLLIVARSDAEGRWIYQQMRNAVTGYRLRGDIKVGAEPIIRLLPAIE